MNTALALTHLFPTSRPNIDWVVVDNGIAQWKLHDSGGSPVPRPTEQVLADAWAAYELAYAASAPEREAARCIAAGEAHVRRAGFTADRKVILLNKLLKAKDADELASVPKLLALYGWMEATQAAAVAGETSFVAAPYSFEEVITE